MLRKPVIRICVEDGVVTSMIAPESVRVTIIYHGGDKDDGNRHCVWCGEVYDVYAVDIEGDGVCPHCDNPTVEGCFYQVFIDSEFLCAGGNRWKRVSDDEAECVESASGFPVGERFAFDAETAVFPY